MIPKHFQKIYRREQIAAATAAMGGEIRAWADEVWRTSHTDLLTIPILRGGLFFFADLVREIDRSVEVAPARTWAYEVQKNGVQCVKVRVNLEGVPAVGRSILLVDDICDSGRTLNALVCSLKEIGAQDVRCAVLIRRLIANQEYCPDWTAFEYQGPEWFVGYGMEDANRWSNLPEVYVIRQPED